MLFLKKNFQLPQMLHFSSRYKSTIHIYVIVHNQAAIKSN